MRLPYFDTSERDNLRLPSGITFKDATTQAKQVNKSRKFGSYLEALDHVSVRHYQAGWKAIIGQVPANPKNHQQVLEEVKKSYAIWNGQLADSCSISHLHNPAGLSYVPIEWVGFEHPSFTDDFDYWCGGVDELFDKHLETRVGMLAVYSLSGNHERLAQARAWERDFNYVLFAASPEGLAIAPPPYAPTWIDLVIDRYASTNNVPRDDVFALNLDSLG